MFYFITVFRKKNMSLSTHYFADPATHYSAGPGYQYIDAINDAAS